ncbi:hypothetical protein GY45DRAFT_793718 [Cubamyces sp. BRFM 1775]|nr:hypothetical protein GY45DRAFT_793718 [Cubamyces sp. BRFM 1775]
MLQGHLSTSAIHSTAPSSPFPLWCWRAAPWHLGGLEEHSGHVEVTPCASAQRSILLFLAPHGAAAAHGRGAGVNREARAIAGASATLVDAYMPHEAMRKTFFLLLGGWRLCCEATKIWWAMGICACRGRGAFQSSCRSSSAPVVETACCRGHLGQIRPSLWWFAR